VQHNILHKTVPTIQNDTLSDGDKVSYFFPLAPSKSLGGHTKCIESIKLRVLNTDLFLYLYSKKWNSINGFCNPRSVTEYPLILQKSILRKKTIYICRSKHEYKFALSDKSGSIVGPFRLWSVLKRKVQTANGTRIRCNGVRGKIFLHKSRIPPEIFHSSMHV
jgi:hypothetical protein